jgi:hypothetical protein
MQGCAWLICLACLVAVARGGECLIVADEQEAMHALAASLRSQGGVESKVVDQKGLPPDLADRPAIFMYVHGGLKAATERALIAYTRAGGRLVILHHGLASARRNNPDWLAFTGMHIAPRNHPTHPWRVVGNTTHTLVNLQPKHYITSHKVTYDRTVEYTSSDSPAQPAEFPALDLPDTEVFLNQHFTDGREKTVLFGFLCRDGDRTIMQDRSGWLKPSEKGWIFYLQPGHRAEDFKNKNYVQIILNCLTWENPS